MKNPRYANGHRRRRIREQLRASGAPCGICGKPIDYSLTTILDPKTGKKRPHPMSFVVDEIVPVSRWYEGGYASPEMAALDPSNCRPAHWICNAKRGNGKKRKTDMPPLPQPWDI